MKLILGDAKEIDDMSTSVQVMTWCRQAISQPELILNQIMPPYGAPRQKLYKRTR